MPIVLHIIDNRIVVDLGGRPSHSLPYIHSPFKCLSLYYFHFITGEEEESVRVTPGVSSIKEDTIIMVDACSIVGMYHIIIHSIYLIGQKTEQATQGATHRQCIVLLYICYKTYLKIKGEHNKDAICQQLDF